MDKLVIPAVSTHPGFRFAAGEAGVQSAAVAGSRVLCMPKIPLRGPAKPGMTVTVTSIGLFVILY